MATAEQRKASIKKSRDANQKQFKKFTQAKKSQRDKRIESGTNYSQKQLAEKYGGKYE